jgi:hypothetical protein
MSVSPRPEHDLPIHADRAQEGGVGDVVVADVVDLESARVHIAQQHVGSVAAIEAAERDKLPIGSDMAQLIACQDRIVPNVVDFVRSIAAAQDHVGSGAGWRRRVRRNGEEEAVAAAVIVVRPDDLARGVDAPMPPRIRCSTDHRQ